MVQTTDSDNSEENCVKAKFWCKTECVDVKARSTFKINKITTPMIKFAHGCDHCSERDTLISEYATN